MEWKNLKAQDGYLYLDDNLIGILMCQLPLHDIDAKFYEPNLINYMHLALELMKVNWDIIEGTSQQELARAVTPGQFLFQ